MTLPILPGAPWLIAHRSMLGINRPYKITLNGKDYVLWQTSTGQIYALDNCCPHRQAQLSSGWINRDRATITCPFHALEFNGAGCKVTDGVAKGSPAVAVLDLVIEEDFIWTYGGHPPQLPIPKLNQQLRDGYEWVCAAPKSSARTPFVNALRINYDYDHSIPIHNDPWQFKELNVRQYKNQGIYTWVTQDVVREENNWLDCLAHPSLMLFPTRYTNRCEHIFPSISVVHQDILGGAVKIFACIYPEADQQTAFFHCLYAKTPLPWFIPLVSPFAEASLELVLEQDKINLEQRYADRPARIRLPNDDIERHALQLYQQWPNVALSETPAH
ncbi:MAG: Rieske 2Fe-2S domain-containing protein [Cyanobacteria bacterium P01_G01_bin.54]